MQLTNVRVEYPLSKLSVTRQIYELAASQRGICWCEGHLPLGRGEVNFAFNHPLSAFEFLLRVNGLQEVSAVIDIQEER